MVISEIIKIYNEFGCNPKEYAQNSIPVHLFIPYRAKSRDNIYVVVIFLIKTPYIDYICVILIYKNKMLC